MSGEGEYRWIGTRPVRLDGIDKVTGRASFGADLSLPGMLHGMVLRSPHAHARLLGIDVSRALAVEGVKSVITSRDLPDLDTEAAQSGETAIDFRDLSRNILARDKVLYQGHAVAALAATSRRVAEQALRLIEVEYEVLPHVMNLDEAMAPGAPLLHPDLRTRGVDPPPTEASNIASRLEIGRGDLEAGFAEAEVIVEGEYTTQTVHQGYIEPQAVVARAGEDDQSVVWCSSQGHFMVRAFCAKLLGLDVSKIKVIPAEVGGAFGGKTTIYLEPLAILLSRRAGRPVKMVMSRQDVFRATGPTSATRTRVKIGAKGDGKITAVDVRLAYEAGAFKGGPVVAGALAMFASYEIENVHIEGYDVVVNKPAAAAYRAPGVPAATFAAESALDELAEKLGIDPIELRLTNAVSEGSQAVYGPRYQAIGFVETLEAARAHPHYRAELGEAQGRGVASGFWFNGGMQSSASLNLNEDGTVVVASGSPDLAGTRTTLAMLAAEELGIPVENVRAVVADTDTIGYSDVSGGSRVTFATGIAVIEATRDVIRQLRERAAAIWDIEVDRVLWRDGRAVAEDAEGDAAQPLGIRELAGQAARTGGPISGSASLNASGAGPGFATHICDVEVDSETGCIRVVRYTAVQDVGRAVHPDYVEGQLQGGVAQGIGWALNEEYVYGPDGRLQNPTFLDYRIPVASDLPMIDTVIVEVPNPNHPYGVRGAGETPIVPPLAAVANAVHAATGVRFPDLPLSPPRVLEKLGRQD
jgi:CO/xanthine dehydrogenase Mo-binding subunit